MLFCQKCGTKYEEEIEEILLYEDSTEESEQICLTLKFMLQIEGQPTMAHRPNLSLMNFLAKKFYRNMATITGLPTVYG